MSATNKIKFGLKNVHYAVVTETLDSTTGKITSTYGDVKAWPGAVNISLDPSGSSDPFYADNSVYAMLNANSGYSGDFESAIVPEDVKTSVYGMVKDSVTGLLVESNTDVQHYIALMFEIDGDVAATRFVNYRCSLTRPALASETNEDKKTPHTDKVTITATPRPDDGAVKASAEKGDTIYASFYSTVPVAGTPASKAAEG